MHEPPRRLLEHAEKMKLADHLSILTEGKPQVF